MHPRILRKILSLLLLCVVATVLVITVIYLKRIQDVNRSYDTKYNDNLQIALRKFPYPYRAGLAISNDVDNTETLEEFMEIHKFLNTKEVTSMGMGVGLKVGNSFLPYEPRSAAISYFSGGPGVAKTFTELMQKGSIDVIHSYGKKEAFSRRDAVAMLQELSRNSRRIDVWVDHDRSTSNLGDDVTFGFGDHPDSPMYHADLTISYGIRFAWLGRVTMVTGQSTPIGVNTFISIYDADHPVESSLNVLKEFSKNILAVFGNRKYAIHKENDLVRIATLDDGQRIYEFIRFDNYWRGVGTGATNKRLADVISRNTLDRLKEVEGYTIVYTHLGKNGDCSQYICEETKDALRNLSKEYSLGNIYVTSTSKLLNYYISHKYLSWTTELRGNETQIRIDSIRDPLFGPISPIQRKLQGITFYVPNSAQARIFLGEKELTRIQRNSPDHTGRESVSILLDPS